MTFIDENGQPPVAIHHTANGRKASHVCSGLILGIIADNKLVNAELAFLTTWLLENKCYLNISPLREVVQALEQLNNQGQSPETARGIFLETLRDIAGGAPQDTGSAGGLTTRHRLDNQDEVLFKDKVFCFTGNFCTGTRKQCEAQVEALGGQTSKQVTKKVDYLVVGVLASRDWSGVFNGEKVEKARGYKEQGMPIKIIPEELWSMHLAGEFCATEGV